MIDAMPNIDFIFGLPGNVKLQALAEETRQRACALWVAVQTGDVVPDAVRLYGEFPYAAGWLQHTALSQAQPLPSACAVKDMLHTLAERLFISVPARTVNTS